MIPFFLLEPEIQERIRRAEQAQREAEREFFETKLAPHPVFWSDHTPKPAKHVCYDAESFMQDYSLPFSIVDSPAAIPRPELLDTDIVCPYEDGDAGPKYKTTWVYRNARFPRGESAAAYPKRGAEVRAYFNDDIITPVLMRHRPWLHSWKVWMSVMPSEIFSQRPAVKRARRKTLIAGLGLGWLLEKVALKRSVEHIVVVEKSKALLDWFGYDLANRIAAETKTYIEVVNADFYTYASNGLSGFNSVLVDIWDTYDGARDSRQFRKILRRYGSKKIWYWGWPVRTEVW